MTLLSGLHNKVLAVALSVLLVLTVSGRGTVFADEANSESVIGNAGVAQEEASAAGGSGERETRAEAIAAERSTAIDAAMADAQALVAGEDYDADSILVLLDGSEQIACDGVSLVDAARAQVFEDTGGRVGSAPSADASSAADVLFLSDSSDISASAQVVDPSVVQQQRLDGELADIALASGGIKVAAAGPWLDGDVIVEVCVSEGASIDQTLESLRDNDWVLGAELNYLYSPDGYEDEEAILPDSINDPSEGVSSQNWHLGSADVRNAWNLVKTNHAVTVVVMDTGCDMDHPDLVANLDTANAWDTYENAPLTGDRASSGHGTHVAGIIAACADNGIGMAGFRTMQGCCPSALRPIRRGVWAAMKSYPHTSIYST